MQPLDKTLRHQLERAITQARELAEAGARAALQQLAVAEPAPFPHLSKAECDLRKRLRAHGRQLGDHLNGDKHATMGRLVEEVAYEHWHRMLFARFLADNDLLRYEGVSVTLEDCGELAAEENAANGWELAARLASAMLPQIFRVESVVFELQLPPEHQLGLERLLTELPVETFTASDALGWVYQFWQSKKKEAVNAAEVKIGARELPAVSQLFTEPYMVAFLLDNSLGAWWAMQRLSEDDLANAPDEATLRQKAAIPGVPLDYLRFVKGEDGCWTPAAGTFNAWPEALSDFKVLDPCCGSGHFLVAAFLMLVPMRMALEDLTPNDAVDAVLSDNLHGLELDRRCVELAAFALALAAWRYPGAEYRPLPELHLACSGLSVGAAKAEWQALALDKRNLRIALDWLHNHFQDAPVLGSLLNPAKSQAARVAPWEQLSAALNQALDRERDAARHEAAVAAQGLAKAAALLGGEYHWVITNVPYLARGKQSGRLRGFCAHYYPAAKNDLATVFLARCLELCAPGGTASIVLPQNWLFLTSYRKFREKLLTHEQWRLIARLGEGGFDSSAAAGAFVSMLTLSRGNASGAAAGLFADAGPAHLIRGLDVAEPRTAADKAAGLLGAEVKTFEQARQLENPDARVAFELIESKNLLSDYARSFLGLGTGGFDQFGHWFWESSVQADKWTWLQSAAQERRDYDGLSNVVAWNFETNRVAGMDSLYRARIHNQDQSGQQAWGKRGVAVALMRGLRCSLYHGVRYDKSMAVLVPDDQDHLPAIYAFCTSEEFHERVREIDQNVIVANGTLVKIPFDLERWATVAKEKYPNGLPKPYSDDPTQWLFHGHPTPSDAPLQVAVARLLGYRWPAETDADMELSDEARDWIGQSEKLLTFADADGIVCIPPVRGEAPAAERLLSLLAAAHGGAWSNDTLARLLQRADHAGKTLEFWLRDKLFRQHCQRFHHRPFIWHIWDGLSDGFAALVNYHKLDYKTLETLTYTYLGDWISRQKQDIANDIDGAEEKRAAAEALKKKLELILKGEAPHDIFVRWKPLDAQPLGWRPDLNDGVRLNIRPFMSVPDVGKKGAGILRDKPNIKWNKDRGKDVESAPWYAVFNGARINDYHLTLEEKQHARAQAARRTASRDGG
jgi:hypothetical protein